MHSLPTTFGRPQAKRLVAGGARFVDIRTPDNYAAEHIPDAASVPLFVPVEGTETFDRIKKFVMATAFAMQATGAAACRHLPFWLMRHAKTSQKAPSLRTIGSSLCTRDDLPFLLPCRSQMVLPSHTALL